MNRIFGSALLGLILVGCGDNGGDTFWGVWQPEPSSKDLELVPLSVSARQNPRCK